MRVLRVNKGEWWKKEIRPNWTNETNPQIRGFGEIRVIWDNETYPFIVDSARIELATDRCERSGIPLTYKPEQKQSQYEYDMLYQKR